MIRRPDWRLLPRPSLFLATLLLTAFSACTPSEEEVYPDPPPETARLRYLAALDSLGLGDSRLVEKWRTAGDSALADSLAVSVPFRETAYLRAEEPEAFSYRFQMREGEALHLYLASAPADTDFFLDLYQVIVTDSTESLRRIFSAEEELTDTLRFESRATGPYLLRLQPELLAAGRFTLELLLQPAYGVFPVSGKDNPDIWSRFGDPRDGGKRSHKGIDIFARRGTPVLAAADGIVRSVRNRGKGGKQVWLRDPLREQALYYAHLDSQLVREGARVSAGDTLGLVGNTGNASGTLPHLHFSIYRRGRGAIDPYPFVARLPGRLPAVRADTALLGQLVRVRRSDAALQAGPDDRSETVRRLPRHLPLRILAASRDRYRVVTPEGMAGYISAGLLEGADRPLRRLALPRASELLERPAADAGTVARVEAEEELEVIGQSEGFHLVRNRAGIRGWMAAGR